MNDTLTPIVCGTFTRARRYPLVVARVWGRRITLNFAVGAALGVGLVWLTRGLWQHRVSTGRAAMAYVIAGFAGGAFLHRGRLDGRAPLWTIYTVLTWLLTEVPRTVALRISVRTVEVTVPAPPGTVVASVPVRPRKAQLWVTPRLGAAA